MVLLKNYIMQYFKQIYDMALLYFTENNSSTDLSAVSYFTVADIESNSKSKTDRQVVLLSGVISFLR
jgi:hypothetical protein